MDGSNLPEVRSTCAYCGVGCGVLLRPDGAGGLTVRGDPDHPANFGRLCSKGTALGETVGLEHRLLTRRDQPILQGDLRLQACRERYGLPPLPAHNALSDALATAELLLAHHARA